MYFCEKCETHIHKHALRYIKHTQTEIMLTAEDSMLNIGYSGTVASVMQVHFSV